MKTSPSLSSLPSTSSSGGLINLNPPPTNNHITQLLQKPKSTIAKTKRVKKNANPEISATNPKKSTPVKRSSIYKGVTRHRWTGRFEAHLWDKFSWNIIQNKKGKQVYLGAYDNEEAAARTYDLAALKYWGSNASLNFPIETHEKEFEEMQKLTKEEYLATLRRQSSGFSRGISKFRGVARHHHNGRWEARIGRVLGNKYLYLGTYGTQEEAAAAYDMAAIQYRGASAVTNFDISHYADFIKQCSVVPNTECQPEPQQQEQQQVQPEKNEKEMMVPDQPLVPSNDASSSGTMQEMRILNDQDFLNWDFDSSELFDASLLVPDVPVELTPCGDISDMLFDDNFEDLLFGDDETDLSWLD